MEVLPVVLAEGAAAVKRNDLDASVAGTRAGVDDAADHEPVLTLLAVHDGLGGLNAIIASVCTSKTSHPAGRTRKDRAANVERRSAGVR